MCVVKGYKKRTYTRMFRYRIENICAEIQDARICVDIIYTKNVCEDNLKKSSKALYANLYNFTHRHENLNFKQFLCLFLFCWMSNVYFC